MKLNEFNNLAEARAYVEYKQKLISSDMLISYMSSFNYIELLDAPSHKHLKALKLALAASSEFNLMEGHPLTIEPLVQELVDENIFSPDFLGALKAYANQEIYLLQKLLKKNLTQRKPVPHYKAHLKHTRLIMTGLIILFIQLMRRQTFLSC